MLIRESLSAAQSRTALNAIRGQNFARMNNLPVDEPIRLTTGP